MKRLAVVGLVLGLAAAVSGGEAARCAPRPASDAAERVSVLVRGRAAYVRWPFDATRDLVTHVWEPANEGTYLVPRGSRTEDCAQGERINRGGDDFSAISVEGFGYMSGNHGSYFAHRQTVPAHGFTAADIGREVTHVESGRTFRLVDVPDAGTLVLHPDGRDGADPDFAYVESGTFRAGGRTWRAERQVRAELFPMSRYRTRRWFDGAGRPIPDGTEVAVDAAELVIEHDVVDPRAIMRYLKDHPGRRFAPPFATRRPGPRVYLDDPSSNVAYRAFAELATLLSVRTVYRYVPGRACLIGRRTTVTTPLRGLDALDVIHGWDGGLPAWTNTVFYVPRLKPMTLKGMDGAPDVRVDLTRGEPLPWPCWKVNDTARKSDCTDPENMPDRFIRVGGAPGRRIGVALGYSLVRGMTALARKGADRPSAYFFWHTGKVYPYSFSVRNVRAGTVFEHVAYKQYFDAEAEPDATSFYCHREGDADYVYLDFHRTLAGKRIRLPDGYAGRTIRVLEKTPSVTLRTDGTVPPDGAIVLDVADGYGTLVLEIPLSALETADAVPGPKVSPPS